MKATMTTNRWGLVLALAAGALFATACESDGSGDNGGNGTAAAPQGKLSAEEVAAGGCSPQADSNGDACKGMDEYTQCALTECASEYDTCLGANWDTGDFSGGTCQAYMECVSAAANTCYSDCTLDDACKGCFTTMAVDCVAPKCLSKLDCGVAVNIPGGNGSDSSCDELLACCNALDGSAKDNCVTAANAAKLAGNDVCELQKGVLCLGQ